MWWNVDFICGLSRIKMATNKYLMIWKFIVIKFRFESIFSHYQHLQYQQLQEQLGCGGTLISSLASEVSELHLHIFIVGSRLHLYISCNRNSFESTIARAINVWWNVDFISGIRSIRIAPNKYHFISYNLIVH